MGLNGHTVLIIEDDCLIAMDLASMLEDLGLAICDTATSEDDAVIAAARHRPGLVVSDFHLRQGDGVSAVRRIQQILDVTVLFVSGSRSELTRREPAAICVDKPYTSDSIASGLSSVLNACTRQADNSKGEMASRLPGMGLVPFRDPRRSSFPQAPRR